MSRRYDRTDIAKVGFWSALVALAGAVGYIVSVPLQVLLTTEAVPVERVRLAKDQVQDEQTVNADVRKELIDMEGEPAAGRPRDNDL